MRSLYPMNCIRSCWAFRSAIVKSSMSSVSTRTSILDDVDVSSLLYMSTVWPTVRSLTISTLPVIFIIWRVFVSTSSESFRLSSSWSLFISILFCFFISLNSRIRTLCAFSYSVCKNLCHGTKYNIWRFDDSKLSLDLLALVIKRKSVNELI